MDQPVMAKEKGATSSLLPITESPLLNRELSWIEFNSRVLDEALDPSQPLLERLKFLAIFSTNLDEFFMIRVSGLQEQLEANPTMLSPDGLSPGSQLRLISERLRPLLQLQMRCLTKQILPGLEEHGVRIIPYGHLNDDQREELRAFFYDRIFPVLTPVSRSQSPFSIYLKQQPQSGDAGHSGIAEEGDEPRFARVKLPPNVPRLIP
jgi:polyphosphate kinase